MKRIMMLLLMACLMEGFAINANAQNKTRTKTEHSPVTQKDKAIAPKLSEYINYVDKYIESFNTGAKFDKLDKQKLDDLEYELDRMVIDMSQTLKERYNEAKGRYHDAKQAHSSSTGNKASKTTKASSGTTLQKASKKG